MVLQFTYDPKDINRDYSSLIAYIAGMGPTMQVLSNTWWIKLPDDSKPDISQLADKLREYLGDTDLMLLEEVKVQSGRDGWLARSAWRWLENNLEETTSDPTETQL